MSRKNVWSSTANLLFLLLLTVSNTSAFLVQTPSSSSSSSSRHRIASATTATAPPLYLFFDRTTTTNTREETSTLSKNGSSSTRTTTTTNDAPAPIPFLLERIPAGPMPSIFPAIAEMCITAFFNDDPTNGSSASPHTTTTTTTKKTRFYKEWQLLYLRKLQTADLERRRRREPDTNMMWVARRVVPADRCSSSTAAAAASASEPLLLSTQNVRHLPKNARQQIDYVRGEVIGFVEVTLRPLGGGIDGNNSNVRPVLTNLSVRAGLRRSGVGSELLQACETAVVDEWGDDQNEIVLEVEEDNTNAQDFYRKRGYRVLYEDPTSRRYDVSGLWLQQVRCKRLVLQKSPLVRRRTTQQLNDGQSATGKDVFQRLRENFLAVVDSR